MYTYAHLVQRNRPRLNNCLDCLNAVLFSRLNVDKRDYQVAFFWLTSSKWACSSHCRGNWKIHFSPLVCLTPHFKPPKVVILPFFTVLSERISESVKSNDMLRWVFLKIGHRHCLSWGFHLKPLNGIWKRFERANCRIIGKFVGTKRSVVRQVYAWYFYSGWAWDAQTWASSRGDF